MSQTIIVMTTINNPANLNSILAKMQDDDFLVIAGDRKTPLIDVPWDHRIIFLDFEKQVRMLRNPIGVPFDSIQRRNVGYIHAIRNLPGRFIISVDDDNMPMDGWVKDHVEHLGRSTHGNSAATNIINKHLITSCAHHSYCANVEHRGLTFKQIHERSDVECYGTGKIMVNAGRWTGDPDINAYDRILHPGVKTARKPGASETIVDPRTWWHPFNSQNTAVASELFPALFLIPMGVVFDGRKMGRYDDIWQSYICQRIMMHHGWLTRFGTPFVKQERNEHSVVRDLDEEMTGMMHTDRIIGFLQNINLYGSSVMDNMYEIADAMLVAEDRLLNYIGNKILWWLSELK